MSLNNSAELILPRVKLTTNTNGSNHIYIDTQEKVKSPDEYVVTARNAFKSGKTRDYSFRLQQLKNLRRFVEENVNKINEALHTDLGRPKMETNVLEITLLRNEFNEFISSFNKWVKPQRQPKSFANIFDTVEIRKDPYGVVLIISPWNYPFLLSLVPIAGAIAGGNCVILKPSEIGVASTRLLAEVLPNYLDSDCYQIYPCGVAETTSLLQHKFDYIFYTGSTRVGKIIYQAASKHLTPCTLELGGKSPTYIDETADIEKTTKRVLFGKLANAGQTCIAPDYILCPKDVEKKFVECAKRLLKNWYGTDPKLSPDFGRIINENNFKRLVSYLDSGNNIAIGGKFDKEQRYIEPTILTGVSINNPIMQEEIFGPILPIVNVDSIYAAIDYINNNEKPLATYIFSKNKQHIEYFLNNTSCGGVTVNDTLAHIAARNLPFGGVGNSGMGSYGFEKTVETFTHQKSVLIKCFNGIVDKFILSNLYPPYTDKKEFIIKTLLKERPLPSMKMILIIIVFVVLIALLIYAFVSK